MEAQIGLRAVKWYHTIQKSLCHEVAKRQGLARGHDSAGKLVSCPVSGTDAQRPVRPLEFWPFHAVTLQ